MPTLLPDWTSLALATAIVLVAQLIYATVGFGAGMFAIALFALIWPDLARPVATLALLTLVTEVWVLTHAWRHARPRLLLLLLPTMALGMWLGTAALAGGNVSILKRLLGLVVLAAGAWFLRSTRRGVPPAAALDPPPAARGRWWALPTGLLSGVLAGLFGTGGPPVIVFLRAHGLDKSAFRATLLWYFFIMSLTRGATYIQQGLLTWQIVYAAVWLLPPTAIGIGLGMTLHDRLSERQFGTAIAGLLIALGLLLASGVGR
jgi:uncharacterized membrane protein YfcA